MTDEKDTARSATMIADAAEWVDANFDKISAALREVLQDENGKTRTPFVLLLPGDGEGGSRIVHNMGAEGDVATILMGAARNLMVKAAITNALPVVLAVIASARDKDDNDGEAPKVH